MTSNKQFNRPVSFFLSILMIITGVLLMGFMIVVEDEPGAIPLLLLIIGTAWLFYIKRKILPHKS
ncbi:MAG: hypothetical protein JXR20_01300 [Balneola sp.]